MLLGLMALVTVVMHMVSSQGRNSNVLRQGGSKHVQSEIVTSRTRAFLSCESGDMVVKVNFTQPFKGLMYAYRSRQSPCRINGNGGFYYQLRIPLKGCGTWQESPRVFVNNITIRFHQALELEEDETKTVVCRYPPPLTPPPGSIHVITPITPKPGVSTRVRSAGISEVEILIIICLLLFFSLLTVGIGIAYFCLKRRNIHLIRRKTQSSGPASQLTKLSSTTALHSSDLSCSILEHMVRIPRAIPYSASVRANTASDRFYEQDDETTESPVISRDSLESSPTTSTTSGGSTGGAAEWLRRSMASSKTLLTIPKAILRKDDAQRRSSMHKRNTSAVTTALEKNRRSEELEDQTVTTLLEPESSDNSNNNHRDSTNGIHKSDVTPVYAKVEKRKQRVRIMEGAQVMNSTTETTSFSVSDGAIKSYHVAPGTAKRREIVIDKAGMKILDEVISNASNNVSKIVTDSKPRLESKTSRINDEKTSHSLKQPSFANQERPRNSRKGDGYVVEHLPLHQKSNISTRSAHIQNDSDIHIISAEKNLCIQDIADIYVTTTVETESTEIRTTVTRDTIEEHVKDRKITRDTEKVEQDKHVVPILADTSETPRDFKNASDRSNLLQKLNGASEMMSVVSEHSTAVRDTDNRIKSSLGAQELKQVSSAPSKPTEGWNVIIRQRKPPTSVESESSSLVGKSETEPFKSPIHFDVKIRTIPPKTVDLPSDDENVTDRRDSTELVDVPKLEMPHSIEKIRSVMAQLGPHRTSVETTAELSDSEGTKTTESKESGTSQSKTVWWPDTLDPPISRYTPEPVLYSTSSDSFRSETSLRERSSSEVLEKAPTLVSHKEQEHPVLERSTSEMFTLPEDHSIWVKEIPVLQSYSPDFLANIPTVTKGGFFHDPASEKSARSEETEPGTTAKSKT